MKLPYGIVFSDGKIFGNEKLFPPFEVRGYDVVTQQSLPPNFGACAENLQFETNY